MTNPQPHSLPFFLRPRVVVAWVVTAAWAGTMTELSTGSYSSSVTGLLLAQLLFLLHIHLTPATFMTIHFLIRKLAHITEYAIFSLLLYHSFPARQPERWNARSALVALFVAALFSLADEYHQSFVPGRTASVADCGIDTTGALLGMVLLYAGRRRNNLHENSAP